MAGLADQQLRVPLDAEEATAVLAFDGLDRAVVGPAGGAQAGADGADGLVVQGVDAQQTEAGDNLQPAPVEHPDVVDRCGGLVLAAVLDVGHEGEVLDQGAPCGHVEDLGPPADAEDGDVAGQGGVDEGQLPGVAAGVDALDLGKGRAAVRRGVHIAAAAEQQAVEAGHRRLGLGGIEHG